MKILSNYIDDDYFGAKEFKQYGKLVHDNLSGKTISKRSADAEEPGGLIYEADKLGIDMYDLLRTLEGMCFNGLARELYPGDSYQVF